MGLFEIIMAASAVASLAYGAYSGETSANQQRKAQRNQAAAQDSAEAAAARQEREAMEAQKKAARGAPDLQGIYDREQRRGSLGPNLTNNISGPLSLGGNSLLGG